MRFTICIEQNIPRLNVSMQDAVLMGVMNRSRQPRDEFCCTSERHRLIPDNFIEFATLHQGHTEVARAVAFSDLMNWHDVRMVEASGSFCFDAKALEMLFCGPGSCRTETNDF